ncbi:hypothetical protein GCM10023231_34300 [Olivibacter ginsenosidimutans]|uniref:5'-nucleotidase, lipoprotein e(P4) family n=2 Tax=Olivibacter ginsenosidimutans TaxID=1176537 RepID=A0ABP9BZQ5_9SPHI
MPEAPAWGALWQQRAAEYRALSYQAYNSARLSLDALRKSPSDKPLAIVTDIDETVLDNSPYYVHQAQHQGNYTDSSWVEWTKQVACDTVPGAPSFFQYAASKGITVFYITNRIKQDEKQTIENLKKFNFPNADDAHLLLLADSSSKEKRRIQVADKYHIIMLLGDNLGDFSAIFNNNSMEERRAWVEKNRLEFGKRFIVLPNHMYGNWEEAFYHDQHPSSFADSNAVLNGLMRSY